MEVLIIIGNLNPLKQIQLFVDLQMKLQVSQMHHRQKPVCINSMEVSDLKNLFKMKSFFVLCLKGWSKTIKRFFNSQ